MMSRTAQALGRTSGDLTRRGFLEAGCAATLGLALPALGRASTPGLQERSVILLNLVGGPSQHETWDPKPDAPREIRGPFGSIATSLPGVRISEHLPRLAGRMHRMTLVRSVCHDAAPIHETGWQLLQTGRLARPGEESPHLGAVVARLLGDRAGAPAAVILPGLIGNTGVDVSRGQSAGPLGIDYEPTLLDPEAAGGSRPPALRRALDLDGEPPTIRDAYGRTPFGENCLRARRLVEAGVRVVTVNMFSTVFRRVSWDCHGAEPFSTLEDYRRELLPTLDLAFSALIDDLARSGRLDTTLVLAAGEFGRSPRINASGGRDHWPAVWSVAMAGGLASGGAILGASDPQGAEPADRPVAPSDLLATLLAFLGLDPAGSIPLPDGRALTLASGASPLLGA